MKKFFALTLLVAFFFSSCEENVQEPGIIQLKAGMDKRIEQDNRFSFELMRQIMTDAAENNVFVSPLSVSIALGMARNGAAGNTLNEMDNALFMSDMSNDQINEYYQILIRSLPGIDKSTKLNIANSLWYKVGFPVKNSFINASQLYFDAEVRELDFTKTGAVDQINGWCAEKTNNLIKKPLDQISADAVLYLINAIYFKGMWTKKFDKDDTYETDFADANGTLSKVNMMQLKDTFPYYEDEIAQYLDLPYGNKSYSMTIILPQQGHTTGEIMTQLNNEKWNSVLQDMQEKQVKVMLPRFRVENKFELKQVLMRMGMIQAFNQTADFSGISEVDLLISRIIHSTYCEVTEDGTEAAAVTIIEFETTSMPMYPVFIANRPFLFVIREQSTGVILFIAKIGKVEKY